jgi:hypothetical protein
MAEVHGKVGAIYYKKATITGDGIAFVDSDPDTITDTGSGFVTAGFEDGDIITVTGTTNNNDSFLVATVAAGTLTLDAGEAVTAEGAGASVTIVEALPGTNLAGFYNWSLSYSADALDVTDFGDGGTRTYISGLVNWTATADKHWLTTGNQDSWIGTEVVIRFFKVYDADPTATTNYYFEGTGIVSGVSINEPVGEVVTQTLSMTGTGTLSVTNTSAAWPT